MELQQYVAIVRRRLLLVIVAIGVATLGGYAATRGKPATYTATTKLQAQQFIDTGLIYHLDLYGSQNLALNDAALATSYPILQQAAARDPTISGGAGGLANKVQAAAIPNTAVLQISARASSPDQAVRSANAVAQAFVASTAAAQQAQFTGTRDNLSHELGRLMIQVDRLEHKINNLQSHHLDAPQAAQLAALQNQQAQLRAEYIAIQGTLQQTIMSQAQPDGVVIVQPASPATVTKSPLTPLRLTALAALGGAILGVGVTFLSYYVSDVLSSTDRVAQESQLPMLGSVVAFASHRANDLIALDSRAAASQDYRLLGAHLSAGTGPKTILITSPQRGDGKTTTVANLAVALAEAGKSVIAVDANVLRPRLHSLFALTNDKGVLDVLRNGSTSDGDHCLQLTERLRVLPTGSLDGNVRAPIAWPRMAQVLADLQQRADVVLIDSPALLESADAALLATHIDDTVVVVDATRTKARVLAAAQALLVPTGASIRGLLLNKVASQDKV